ncbi:MAG TPA: sulfite exporter TauE/SafE family protein [Arenimonas sp.]|uniref:sulfite exporter TauE/SafE family protein n=1 Tax=Arenimonas sp. TaxID=1872635 RepID=UPI002C4208C4|nr:sulfite exporter TauE/SafE family protein [Arenimonas sp.]HMB56587.1 sulfite exporter TauE/SafE family protein [Arenimonas sp.]
MPIDLLTLTAAWLSGLFGGVHCLAMCGGIATGFSATSRATNAFRHALLLNLGRIGGYTLAGALAGGLGGGVLRIARVDGLALGLRTLVGLVLVVTALRLLLPTRLAGLSRLGHRVWQLLQPLRERTLPAQGPARTLVLGLFWGWLPCGLSTTLLMAAWLEASALHGGLLMLAFGLGTLPLMTGVSWSGAHFARHLAQLRWRIAAAAAIAVAGLVTITAPWLGLDAHAHAVLTALGCRSLLR